MSPKTPKLLLLFLAITASLLLFRSAGTFLIKNDLPQKTTHSIILMGSIADRVVEAKDRYEAQLTNKIILVNSNQTGLEALAPYGITLPNNTGLSIQTLRQLGIPDSSIIFLPGKTKSTRDEADTLVSWIKKNNIPIQSISIITSSAHTRRAAMIFNDAFSDNNLSIQISTAPSKYRNFNAQKWYTDRESAKQVFLEYTKLASFLLAEQWQ